MSLDPDTRGAELIARLRKRAELSRLRNGPDARMEGADDIQELCDRHEALLRQALAMERAIHGAIKAGEQVARTVDELTDRAIEEAR